MRRAPASTWPLLLATLGIVSLLWRLSYFSRLAATPLSESLVADARVYWDWAGNIRAHGLLGTHPFFFGPLYPYVLAGLRCMVGDSIPHVLWVQAAWGAAATVLLADAARRLTRPGIALIIGGSIGLYEMAVFFDGLILMESLLFVLEALLLWMVVRTDWADARARSFGALGLLIGVLAEGRATAALLLIPACALALPQAQPRRLFQRLSLLCACFIVVALPAALHNYVTSREFIPFTYNFGYNLYVGNGPQATGGFEWITDPVDADRVPQDVAAGGGLLDGRDYLLRTEALKLSPAASSRHWAAKAIDYARQSPAHVAGLTLRKFAMLWNRREYAQVENADEYRMAAGPLGLPWIGSFACLGALAVAGMLFAWRCGRAARFVLGYAAVTTLGIVPFFVTDRYRHHLIPACALLAAMLLERVWRALRARDSRMRGALAGALAVGIIVVCLPAPSFSHGRYAWNLAADLGTRFLQRRQADLALRQFEEADRLEQRGSVRFDRSHASDSERADLWFNHGSALVQLGRSAEAAPWFERALTRSPEDARIMRALSDADRASGREEEAAKLDARLAPLEGGSGAALARRGFEAAQAGRFDEAERLFLEAVRSDPTSYGAWGALIRLRVQKGDLPGARTALDDARRQGLPPAPLRAHEALVAAASGDSRAAEVALAQLPAGASSDQEIADVIAVTHRLLARGSLR